MGTHVHARRFNVEVAVDDDPIERRHGMARVEARPGGRQVELGLQLLQAPGDGAPFVGVAHQHGRHFLRALGDRIEDRAHLPPAPQPREIQVHADDAQRLLVNQELGNHGAARLERREFQRGAVKNADMALHQDRIAVPADVASIELEKPIRMFANLFQSPAMADTEVHRLVHAVAVDERVWHRRAPSADPLVGFLERNDIRVDLLQYLQHATWVAAPIEAHRFVHVVGGDGDRLAAGHTAANNRRA